MQEDNDIATKQYGLVVFLQEQAAKYPTAENLERLNLAIIGLKEYMLFVEVVRRTDANYRSQ